jgi:WD40 repeat protein
MKFAEPQCRHGAVAIRHLRDLTLIVVGMVMAVKLVHYPVSTTTLILSGYEGGLTAIHQLPSGDSMNVRSAQLIYLSQPHSQPILSLDVSPDAKTYYTSSADAVIAAHVIPVIACATEVKEEGIAQRERHQVARNEISSEFEAISEVQNNVSSSADGTLEQASPVPQQKASLSFAKQPVASSSEQPIKVAGLSSLLSSAPSSANVKSTQPMPIPVSIQLPHKTTNTKHSGQQSLRVRSDGRIFATGGWDSRIRIYSSKTLKEVATLKWHKEGVYAVDFAEVLVPEDLKEAEERNGEEQAVAQTGLGKLQRQREEQMQLKHWIVAGAKDGKVSLWEIF